MTPNYVEPIPSDLNKESICSFATKFAAHACYTPGTDIEEAVNRVGGRILIQDFWNLDSSDSGSILIERDASFAIYIARHTAATRDRFTIAHELGHLCLHFLLRKASDPTFSWGMRAARFGTGRCETEANLFAAEFLMPALTFENKFRTTNGNLASIADHFGVSISAAGIRAQSLGLQN